MNFIFRFLRERRFRKTKEDIAYWSAKAEIYRQICKHEHTNYDEWELCKAYANQSKYQARLQSYTEFKAPS